MQFIRSHYHLVCITINVNYSCYHDFTEGYFKNKSGTVFPFAFTLIPMSFTPHPFIFMLHSIEVHSSSTDLHTASIDLHTILHLQSIITFLLYTISIVYHLISNSVQIIFFELHSRYL